MLAVYEYNKGFIVERKTITDTEILTQFYNTETNEEFEQRTGVKPVVENAKGLIFREWSDTFTDLGWKSTKDYIRNRMTSPYRLIENPTTLHKAEA